MLDARVVIVNHRSGDRLGRLLDVLAREAAEVVVVDNDSGDGSDRAAEAMAASNEQVRLIRLLTNTGFSAGANDGARGASTDWLVFVNPDVHAKPGDLPALLASTPGGVVAPVQTDERGTPRLESAGFDPSLPRFVVWALLPSRMHGRLGPWIAAPSDQQDMTVDWVSGAMLAIRRDLFERLGGFDERYFLYVEDVDLGRRAREAGAPVTLRGRVRVYHEVADGDPDRRARATARWVTALGIAMRGWRRRVLGAILLVGFVLRALSGDRGARQALPRCVDLIVSRW